MESGLAIIHGLDLVLRFEQSTDVFADVRIVIGEQDAGARSGISSCRASCAGRWSRGESLGAGIIFLAGKPSQRLFYVSLRAGGGGIQSTRRANAICRQMLRAEWDRDCERAAYSGLGLDTNCSAVQLDQFLYKCQADTAPKEAIRDACFL